MNPIALRHGRRIYAYACGRCHVIGSVSDRMVYTPGDEPARIKDNAEHSRQDAAACCLCRDCKIELAPGTTWGLCPPCEAIEKKRVAGVISEMHARDDKRGVHNHNAMASVGADAEAAVHLLEVMREISETCYLAGWLIGIERTIWSFAIDPDGAPHECIRGEVSRAEVESLRALSQKARGWWHWDDDLGGEVFVPMAEWERLYAAGP